MTNEFINFDNISRKTWQELHRKIQPLLTAEELESIKSLNDNISIQDVVEVYLPLISLIQIYKNAQENLSFSKSIFLKKKQVNARLSLVFPGQLLLENQRLAAFCSFSYHGLSKTAKLKW